MHHKLVELRALVMSISVGGRNGTASAENPWGRVGR
jgi:hypothetical protein